MKLRDLSGQERTAKLSKNSSSSSYGKAVLVVDGEAHGWFDVTGWAIIKATKGECSDLERAGYFLQKEEG